MQIKLNIKNNKQIPLSEFVSSGRTLDCCKITSSPSTSELNKTLMLVVHSADEGLRRLVEILPNFGSLWGERYNHYMCEPIGQVEVDIKY